MALKRNERYPGRFDNPTAAHPQGAFKNRTTPTAKDGSYLERDWANDWDGFMSSLLNAASITPNGSVDEVGASQYFSALLQVISDNASNTLDTLRINVASAATVNLTTSAPDTRHINITGTTTITQFAVAAGLAYFVRFDAALTLTNNANIVTQRGASITVAAGDTCIIRATANNVVEVLCYTPAIPQALGYSQTWQNLTIWRAANTTYTNTTGRPIEVIVVYAGVSAQLELQVNGATIWRQFAAVSAGTIYQGARVLVPAGATYGVVDTIGTLHSWTELR